MFSLGLIAYSCGTGFITEWVVSGEAPERTITLPLVEERAEGALSYECLVDWGDGSTKSLVTAWNDADRIHTYALDGTYQVEITGTCEGWSFNEEGDYQKITKIVNWGDLSKFNGFKYLKGGFAGCYNLTSLGTGSILASGTGVLTDGFDSTFLSCGITTIPSDLFKKHTAITSHAFDFTFFACEALTQIPADLFRYNTALNTNAFNYTFGRCSVLENIPTNLFKYNTSITTDAFNSTFSECSLIEAIPTDLFRYNTLISTSAFYATFEYCELLTDIPVDLFRYNTAITTHAFDSTFTHCTALVSVPTDLFRYNVNASTSSFYSTFAYCSSLASVPTNLFKYNTNVDGSLGDITSFALTFYACTELALNANIFYADGEQNTRFLNKAMAFKYCFSRESFTGTQGVAPDLWDCDFGATITLDVAPATDWEAGDIITGQTSGATSVVVAKTSTLVYHIYKQRNSYELGEEVGVTGVPAKLAQQLETGNCPYCTGTPVSTGCFEGAGNSLTSLSNYADIPANWI